LGSTFVEPVAKRTSSGVAAAEIESTAMIIRKPFKKNPEAEAVVKLREIKALVHFTPLENVESILINGILPRFFLEYLAKDRRLAFRYADKNRHDGKHRTCLSITHPNRLMFQDKRDRKCNAGITWVVLLVEALPVLSDPETVYTRGNASKYTVDEVAGIDGLKQLFRGIRRRKPARFPTSSQSEVRTSKIIDPSLIYAVCHDGTSENTASRIRRAVKEAGRSRSTKVFAAHEYFDVTAAYGAFVHS
jgi:hypothetical protein